MSNVEKYLSGVTHPTETLESFRRLDIVDKERFIEMLLDEDGVINMFEEALRINYPHLKEGV